MYAHQYKRHMETLTQLVLRSTMPHRTGLIKFKSVCMYFVYYNIDKSEMLVYLKFIVEVKFMSL